jgi:hypothetical protein
MFQRSINHLPSGVRPIGTALFKNVNWSNSLIPKNLKINVSHGNCLSNILLLSWDVSNVGKLYLSLMYVTAQIDWPSTEGIRTRTEQCRRFGQSSENKGDYIN